MWSSVSTLLFNLSCISKESISFQYYSLASSLLRINKNRLKLFEKIFLFGCFDESNPGTNPAKSYESFNERIVCGKAHEEHISFRSVLQSFKEGLGRMND